MLIRAHRFEIIRPLGESWDQVGPTMHLLRKVTPKLVNAALDARIACGVVGTKVAKEVIAPSAKAASGDGLAYQAVINAVAKLREWGVDKNKPDYAALALSGGMMSEIARAACSGYKRRDQGRQRFESEIIFVRTVETKIESDDIGTVLVVKLRPAGTVRFAVARSSGRHAAIERAMIEGKLKHGDCKIKWDERKRKWYALVAYEAQREEIPHLDPKQVLAVHRGMRNALYMLASYPPGRSDRVDGRKFLGQRQGLQARMREMRKVSAFERGDGAKGHGSARRFESHDALEGKLSRVTHTFCQQIAAAAIGAAIRMGCGSIVMEDYGGIEEDNRFLGRFPFYEMKQAIQNRAGLAGIEINEVPSEYISSSCPRCKATDTSFRNTRTGIFHCRICLFDRPADYVAAYWLLTRAGGDMAAWDKMHKQQLKVEKINRDTENVNDGGKTDDQGTVHELRRTGSGVQAAPSGKRRGRGRVLPVPRRGRA